MRTQILLLESHDDVISARDKMSWGKAGRILLVWPDHGRILDSSLDLVLLVRHGAALGSQIAIVTHDLLVSDNAHRLGLPCFSSIDQARRVRWRRTRKPPQLEKSKHPPISLRQGRPEKLSGWTPGWLAYPGVQVTLFSMSILSVLALCAFLLPAAHIELILPRVEQTIDFPVLAGPEISHVSPAGLLPLKETNFIVEGQESMAASGWTTVPDQFAVGTVQFSNLTGQAVDIPAGTVVLALRPEKIRFVTTTAGKIDSGVSASIEIPVRAAVPGKQGNLQANSIQGVEGELGLRVSVDNLEPTGGGSDRLVRAPDTADRVRLRNRLLHGLTNQAREDVQNRLGETVSILKATVVVKDILEEQVTPDIGQPSDVIEIRLRVEFQASYVDVNDLNTLAQMALDANLPYGYQPVNENITIKTLDDFQLDSEGRLVGQIQASRALVLPLPVGKLTASVRGLPAKRAADEIMAGFQLEDAPRVLLSPSWWPWLPFFQQRIRFSNLEG